MAPLSRFEIPLCLALVALSGSVLAQKQFTQTEKVYLPADLDSSRGVVAADVDKDGDQDLFFCNDGVTIPQPNRLLLNDGKGRFTDVTATHLPGKADLTGAAAFGDVDKDGDLDLVLANTGQNRLLLNDGTGKFVDATAGRLPLQDTASIAIELHDFDGDGDLDIALAILTTSQGNRLYLNDGTGKFTDVSATQMPAGGGNCWDMTSGDVDKDGDRDLVFANQGQVQLFLNDGNGKFSDVTTSKLPVKYTQCGGVALGDVDKDGDLDLVLAIFRGQDLLYSNDGTGQFTDVTAGRIPKAPDADKVWTWKVAVEDINGDTYPDIVFAVQGQNRVYINDGKASFTDVTDQQLADLDDISCGLVLADFDGDSDLDIVFANIWDRSSLYFNDGTGNLAHATEVRLPGDLRDTMAMELGDVDNDGDLDLVVANSGEYEWQNTLLLNDGRGKFTDFTLSHFPEDTDDSRAVALGDVDKDGDLDVVFGNSRARNKLYLNDGAGKFTDVTSTHLPADLDPTSQVALGDVDKDGDLDLVVANYGVQHRLYLNDGSGKFADATSGRMPALVSETRDLALVDVDKDGDLDIVLANGGFSRQRNGLYLNDGTGKFTDVSATQMPNELLSTACLAVGDVDGDGDPDLVFGNNSPTTSGQPNALYLNDGNGKFSRGSFVYDYFETLAIELADVDGDGDLDVFCGDQDHTNKLYLNDGKGGFSDVTEQRMPNVLEATRALAAGDVDGDQDVDLITGNVGAITTYDYKWVNTLYQNHERHLSSPVLAETGASFRIEASARPGYASGSQLALLFANTVPLATPIQIPPFGAFGINPVGMLQLPTLGLPAPAGHAILDVTVPSLPSLVGQTLFVQGLVLHSANLMDARFTNVLAERIYSF